MPALEQFGITKRAMIILSVNLLIAIASWLMTLSSFRDMTPLQVGGLLLAIGNTAASWLNKSPENPIKTYAATPPPGTVIKLDRNEITGP